MQRIAVVIGGSGFIGGFLITRLLEEKKFDKVFNLDLREARRTDSRYVFRKADVRLPLEAEIGPFDPAESWIFNLAALCREPGSEPQEYFDTNVGGAERVTEFAERHGFSNLYFTSTMSSYGRMEKPTPETARQYPETPYGISKLVAEKIHENWWVRKPGRRLVICRPGVIFGPGDKENIPRMIRAIGKGYFMYPGRRDIVKGYGYVHGLVDSVEFVLARREEPFIVYNYAERDCLPLEGMVKTIQDFLGKKAFAVRMPMGPLVAASVLVQSAAGILGKKSPIHPVRVRKVAFPTHLKPAYLLAKGFEFRYPLEKALEHWRRAAPEDFERI